MSIGYKIKTLRRAKELTQEELAEMLGVSSKAISQWECNRTSPDISQLPMLCNFFEVTADELLGIDVFHKTAERDKVLDMSRELAKNGKIEEALAKLREGIKRFPNDATLMSCFIYNSTTYVNCRECTNVEKEQIAEECRGYSEYILEHSVDDWARYSAIGFLSQYYHQKGEDEKALEHVLKLPPLCNSREFLFPELNTGTDKAHADQDLKLVLFHFFVIRMLANYQLDTGEWLYTEDELIKLRDKKFALFSLLFEQGDYGFFGHHLAESHEMQARKYAKQQDKEKCLHHLEQAVNSAVDFIDYMKSASFVHSSLLWKGFDYPSKRISLSERENIAAIILSRLEMQEYNFVRDDIAFSTLADRLSNYAGHNDY